MTGALTLTVTTPLEVVLDESGVVSVRAEDASGGFGVLPGHASFLTVLGASVLRWRKDEDRWRFCALRGGVLRVVDVKRVEVACRKAVLGDDLSRLESIVRADIEAREDEARRSRGEQTRLHATAIRRLMQQLRSRGDQELMELAESMR